MFGTAHGYIPPETPLQRTPHYKRLKSYIAYGNQLRKSFDDDAALAAATVRRIIRKRAAQAAAGGPAFEKTAYLLYQFKRKEEIQLLRSVYGRLFFQISAYSRKGARIDRLARAFARSAGDSHSDANKELAEEIVRQDANEVAVLHGQRVSNIFHDAEFIINLDCKDPSPPKQVERFFEILFSSNKFSPSKMEYGMFAAKAAALRSLDLSRQVGAAIFSESGEIVSLGSNEVPKAEGGTYWSDGKFDARDYTWGFDPNAQRKSQLLKELAVRMGIKESKLDALLARKDVQDSQKMDALEYGRVLHAEMNAITDAARLGRSTRLRTY